MVSNFPRLFVARNEYEPRAEQIAPTEGFGERVFDRVREAFCGLHGHDNLLQFHHDRLFLKCVSCGHKSPGWELNETPPIAAAQASNRQREPLVGSQLIDERRIA